MPLSPRHWLMRVGDHLTRDQVSKIKGAVRYLEAGCLMRELGYRVGQIDRFVETKERLFDLVGSEVGERAVLYLEFGVYQGYSMRYWTKVLRHPKSILHGFDSFEGLPEAWNDATPKGCFSTHGKIPVIDDPRVRLFKGWFDQTLSKYDTPDHDVLVINFDADLYSSTVCVLDKFASRIVPGTYLYFDEFGDPQHELRAFMEFFDDHRRRFKLRGATHELRNVLFQCVA
jgi:hypothetical protein